MFNKRFIRHKFKVAACILRHSLYLQQKLYVIQYCLCLPENNFKFDRRIWTSDLCVIATQFATNYATYGILT